MGFNDSTKREYQNSSLRKGEQATFLAGELKLKYMKQPFYSLH